MPDPPAKPAMVTVLALVFLRMVFATELMVAPLRVSAEAIVDVSLLPIVKALLGFKSNAPSVSEPLALPLFATPLLGEVLLKLIPKLDPPQASVVNDAMSPLFPSAVVIARASTPANVLVGPPVQLPAFNQAVLFVVVFQV